MHEGSKDKKSAPDFLVVAYKYTQEYLYRKNSNFKKYVLKRHLMFTSHFSSLGSILKALPTLLVRVSIAITKHQDQESIYFCLQHLGHTLSLREVGENSRQNPGGRD